jgi:hypothetical protein
MIDDLGIGLIIHKVHHKSLEIKDFVTAALHLTITQANARMLLL